MQIAHLLPILIPIVMLGLFIPLIIYGMRRWKQQKAVWRGFGESLGLRPEQRMNQFDRFAGILQEFPCTLSAQGTQQGKHKDTNHLQIDATLELIGLPEGISVYRETFSSKIGKLFHTQDIEVGDPEFDREFKVKGKGPDEVRMYLISSGRSQTFYRLAQGTLAGALLTAPGLKLHLDARLDQPAELEAVRAALLQLCDLARALR